MGLPPLLELADLSVSYATNNSFASALKGVLEAEVEVALPSLSPDAHSGWVTTLFILHLRFLCGVAGDTNLPRIW